MFLLLFTAFFVFDSELTSGERISGSAAVVMMVSFFYIGHLSCRCIPIVLNRRVRLLTGLSGYLLYVLWLVGFVYAVLPRLDFTVNQLFMAICWAWTLPLGFLDGLISGLDEAALKKTALADS